MGLDMYVYTAPVELVGDAQVDMENCLFKDGYAVEGVDTYFAFWRKFNNLHGWMENLYRAKGGTKPDFNCAYVRLMPQDLGALEAATLAGNLPATAGFFFGPQRVFTKKMAEEIMEFIDKARKAIANNQAVIYSCWW